MRTRQEPEANYSSVFIDGKTLRIPIDRTKPITEIKYPEFYDISLGDKCVTGKCNYCYASGNPKGRHYENVTQKVNDYFGPMTLNQRPYQVAIGGQQEPLEHPEIESVLKAFKALEIVPNMTTNGVLVNEETVDMVKMHCGGIAVTMHPHLQKHWEPAIELFIKHKVRTNVHIIVSDEKSVEFMKKWYPVYNGRIDYFVLLPYMNVGYAAKRPKTMAEQSIAAFLDENFQNANIAMGANFYKFLCDNRKWNVSLYPPEILSKYLVMDEKMGLYNNSFEMKPVQLR
jgi:hypothetical protein